MTKRTPKETNILALLDKAEKDGTAETNARISMLRVDAANPLPLISDAVIRMGVSPALAALEENYKLGLTEEQIDCLDALHTYNAFLSADAAYIYEEDGNYYYKGKRGKLTIDTRDTLPGWMAERIGMLKLVDIGVYITSVGHRLAQDVFFVVRGED